MLYDIPRNYIGDQHWTEEEHLQEGDEVLLEKVGVRVEVAERTGETETDLSELRARRGPAPGVEPRDAREWAGHGAMASSATRALSRNVAKGNPQPKHRSLNALLGTPKGAMGKAVLPTRSPFEERHANLENEKWEGGRPAKRPRVAAKRTPKSAKQDGVPLWARTTDSKANQQQQQQPGDKIFIDLSDDVTPLNEFLPGFSSDALAPLSPSRGAARDTSGISSSPAFRNHQSPGAPAAVPVRRKPDEPRMQELNHESNIDAAVAVCSLDKPQKPPDAVILPSTRPSHRESVKTGQTLRLAATAPKKRMLLCQDQLSKKPHRTSSIEIQLTAEQPPAVPDSGNDRPNTAKERVQQRIDSVRRKRNAQAMTLASARTSVSTAGDSHDLEANAESRDRNEAKISHEIPVGADIGRPKAGPEMREHARNYDHARDGLNGSTSRAPSYSEEFGQQSSHEVSAIELVRLDRMMLPPAAPRRAPTPHVPIPSQREVRPLRRVISEPPNLPNSVPDKSQPTSNRVPGAPVRYTPTPSPTKRSRESTPVPPFEKEARAPFKRKPQDRLLQKSVSLNVTSAGTSTVILGRPFQAPGKRKAAKTKKQEPPPEEMGPWSREAFDLFNWRPPGWDEEKWCVVDSVEGGKLTTATAGSGGGASLIGCLKDKGA